MQEVGIGGAEAPRLQLLNLVDGRGQPLLPRLCAQVVHAFKFAPDAISGAAGGVRQGVHAQSSLGGRLCDG